MYKFQRHADDLMDFYQKRFKVKQVPQVVFKDDKKNSQNVLGRTGQYDPHNKVVTIFVTGRHGKDVLRSLAHELIHHLQNERGDLANIGSLGPGYAQKDDHMRNMEREAYEQGNLCLRDWEDQIKTNNIQLYETIYKADGTKENITMNLYAKQTKQTTPRLNEAVMSRAMAHMVGRLALRTILVLGWAIPAFQLGKWLGSKIPGRKRRAWVDMMNKNPRKMAAVLRDYAIESGKFPVILQPARRGWAPTVKVFNTKEERTNYLRPDSPGKANIKETKDKTRTKGDSVMSLKEQRNVNFHNKLMESWGFSKKDEESVLLKEEKAPAGEPTSENIEEGAGVGLTMDFIDGWKGGQRTNDGDEGDDEENTQVLKTNHPNDPGNRTKYNKKVEETIRKAIRNILNEIM